MRKLFFISILILSLIGFSISTNARVFTLVKYDLAHIEDIYVNDAITKLAFYIDAQEITLNRQEKEIKKLKAEIEELKTRISLLEFDSIFKPEY